MYRTFLSAFLLLVAKPAFPQTPPSIWKAVENCDIKQTIAALETKPDLNAMDAEGRTPLVALAAGTKAATSTQYKRQIGELLLEAGADPNAQDTKGYTAMHYAAFHGAYDFLHTLAKSGADPNLKNLGAETALHLACRGPLLDDDRLKTINGLLEAKADPQAADAEGRQALQVICAHETRVESPQVVDETLLQIIQRFQQAGADIQHRDLKGRSALYFAMQMGHRQSALFLLRQGCSTSIPAFADYPALHLAAESADLEMVQTLLSKGSSATSTSLSQHRPAIGTFFIPKGSNAMDVALICQHESKDAARIKLWKSIEAELGKHGVSPMTYANYVKGFEKMKGKKVKGKSKTGISR